jgi:hypothetical protein
MFALINNQSATFSRWLNVLLVVFILYGTTVEAAHRHNRVLPSPAGATSQVDNEQTTDLASNKTGCNDCLICQLHQKFATTLIALRLSEAPAQLPHAVGVIIPRDLLSQVVSPLAGRAPPFIS